MRIPQGEYEVVYLQLFPFSLNEKAKAWLQCHPNYSLTCWNVVEEKFFNRFFPPTKHISVKLEISTCSKGLDEPFCET